MPFEIGLCDVGDFQQFLKELPRKAGLAVLLGVTGTMQVVATTVERAYNFFVNIGYSREASAGIVGNLKAESGKTLDSFVVGDGGRARGIAQWHPDRFRGLKKHAAATGRDWHDLEVQLEYIEIELKTRETLADMKLRHALSVEEGTKAFVHFERPQHYTRDRPERAHSYRKRLQYARVVYAALAH